MLNPAPTERWPARLARFAFFAVTPLAFLLFLLRGREHVIVVGDNPFWIGNFQPSGLPPFLAEVFGYGYYTATAAAAVVAVAWAIWLRTSRRAPRVAPLVWYLPALVSGVEAMAHAQSLGSRHGFTNLPSYNEVKAAWYTACTASLTVVVLCTLLGLLLTFVVHRRTRFPLAAVGLLASVATAWCALLSLFWLPG